MRLHYVLTLAAALSLAPVASVRADVQIAMRDGRVTMNAAGATVREILAAWAKVGQTRIVNAERVSGGPVTLHLQDIPEEQALEIILRSVSGYLAAPRANAIANASRYDRIFVMPTSTPPRTAPAPQPAFPQPQFNPTIQQPPPFDADDDDPTPNPTCRRVSGARSSRSRSRASTAAGDGHRASGHAASGQTGAAPSGEGPPVWPCPAWSSSRRHRQPPGIPPSQP